MSGQTVVIIGGGVAGLSAAHELAERGFAVDVFEMRPALGGKAQSQYVAGTGRGGRRDLPGEHGFRFFPAFYRHVIDTMARIPDRGHTVKDNLRPTSEAGLALADGQPIARMLRRMPETPGDLAEAFRLSFGRLGITAADSLMFSERIIRYYTSCARRRLEEYEAISWWDFLGGDRYSPAFQRYLAAVPRTMVAMDARHGSARTIGDVSMQLLMDQTTSGDHADRLLCGPTTETWIDPWRQHLERLGVRFHRGRARALHVRDRALAAVELDDGRLVHADHFVVAVPLEALRPLISAELALLDPGLGRLRALPAARFDRLTSWMNGLQFYLGRDVPIMRGHMFYPDSPWAITSVSQPQFWRDAGAFESRYGDGSVRGLISVDLSDWTTPGTYIRKPARDCTPDEVASEVWQQLRAAITTRRGAVLRDADLVGWHLDDELERRPGGGLTSHARLLVHPPGSWHHRPEAVTALPNLTLAGDYVRTHTDIASMEGANEAARHAVNAILDRADSPHARCGVWPMQDHEPAMFARAKQLDARMMESTWTRGRHAFDLIPGARATFGAIGGVVDRALALGRSATVRERSAA
jgi:15-cis-phytoene desaturase